MLLVVHSLFLGGLCAVCAAGGPTRWAQRPRQRGSCLLAAQPQASAPSDGALAGLTEEEASVVRWLASDAMGQSHLFERWESASPHDKRRLLAQVLQMDARYPQDEAGLRGLEAYVAHARRLLADSAADKNPFEGYAVGVPEGERMEIGSEAFRADERAGAALLRSSAFVLVAGGLGERLGYRGIKLSLPTETLSGVSFLGTYAASLAAIREAGGGACPPLVIMTSADTHDQTVDMLEENGYFGMDRARVHLIQQANVPALKDNDAAFVASEDDPFTLATKPHGHGDVSCR
jgi:UDP-sugar pyrophosphorylase